MISFNQETEYQTQNFDYLKSICLGCDKCELSQTRTQVVFGSGPSPCDLMIVGEGPGEQEDLSGKPFVGRAGQLLTKILESVGIKRDSDAFIANIVKCRPPGNRNPEANEVAQCQAYLIRQIQLVQPKVLILLGSPALKSFFPNSDTISKVRGKWIKADVPYSDEPLYIMPAFHPSYLLRQSSKDEGSPKWLTWQDFKEVKAALDFHKNTIQ